MSPAIPDRSLGHPQTVGRGLVSRRPRSKLWLPTNVGRGLVSRRPRPKLRLPTTQAQPRVSCLVAERMQSSRTPNGARRRRDPAWEPLQLGLCCHAPPTRSRETKFSRTVALRLRSSTPRYRSGGGMTRSWGAHRAPIPEPPRLPPRRAGACLPPSPIEEEATHHASPSSRSCRKPPLCNGIQSFKI